MMHLVPVTIFMLTALIPDLYIWYFFLKGTPTLLQAAHFLPLILLICAIIINVTHIGGLWPMRLFFILLICLVLPKLIFFLLSLIVKIVALPCPIFWKYGNIAALACSIIIFGTGVYGSAYGWRSLKTQDTVLEFENLPKGFDGYRMVQISDFHIGTYLWDKNCVDRIVETINSHNADMVVFTGDMVNSDPDELEEFKKVLSSIMSKDGVYSILGNHDYCMYRNNSSIREQILCKDKVISLEREMGWDILLNENRLIRHSGDSIRLIGVENDGRPPFPQYADMKKAMNGIGEGEFKIMLSHDPTHWKRTILPETDIDLTLSGHTHATQFKLFGFTPSKFIYDEWGGKYEQDGRILYVSTGVGNNLPFRFGAWPQIEIFTLRCKK